MKMSENGGGEPLQGGGDEQPEEEPGSVVGEGEPSRITIVVPTRNEAENVEPLIDEIARSLLGVATTVIFVDDSDDDTAARVLEVGDTRSSDTLRISLIERKPDERHGGLSGAVMAGLRAAETRWVCVMDGDRQHPPECVNRMIDCAESTGAGLVAASRYTDTGSSDGLSGSARKFVSRACGSSAKRVFAARLAGVSDPMTGFFLVDTERLDLGLLRPHGFKILLEILVSHPQLEAAEVPFRFGSREAGKSKASLAQGWHFTRQLVELRSAARSRLGWKYNLHDVIAIRSDRALPEMEKFLVRAIPTDVPVITVSVGDLRHLPPGESIDLTGGAPVVNYRERAGFAMSLALGDGRTDIMVSRSVARSPHVMYTNVVEPVLRWRLVESGRALVHAACFADHDDAYLVTALTDTGKTTTMLKVLDQSDLAFVSDDLIMLSPDGTVLTFPKPLTISHHTVHALHDTTLTRFERLCLIPQSRIHSRQGRVFAFILTKFRLPVASVNGIIQRIVPPPKYHVERLVRGVRSSESATARGMFIIQRGGTGDEPLSTADALQTLMVNCDDAFGFPPYSSLERLLLAASNDDLRTREREIISEALSNIPVVAMRSETLDWAERMPEAVDTWMAMRTSDRSSRLADPAFSAG